MGNSPGSSTNSSSSSRKQRTVPRYSFVAMVEIIEPASETHISGRVAEISRKGCYVDILNTLPKGTLIRVRIVRDKGTFSSPGQIIYVQEQMGMGVAFVDPPPDQLRILDAWLNGLDVTV
jgi:hypothetical protein